MDEIKRYELKCRAIGIKPLKLSRGVNGVAVVSDDYEGIKECIIPKFVDIIEKNAFRDVTSLERVDIKSGVKIIGEYAFDQCSELRTINLENIESIENFAFYKCGEIRHTNLSSIKDIGEKAFMLCKKLESVKFNGYIEKIRDYAFSDCYNLNIDKDILKNIREIGNQAFGDCRSIKGTLELNNVKRLGECSFIYSGIEELIIRSDVVSIEYRAFMCCGGLKKVKIEGETEYIGNDAFAFCGELKEVELGNNIREIGEGAFKYCGMETMYIPKSVEIIRSGAFCDCIDLKRVTLSENTEIEELAFDKDIEIVRY